MGRARIFSGLQVILMYYQILFFKCIIDSKWYEVCLGWHCRGVMGCYVLAYFREKIQQGSRAVLNSGMSAGGGGRRGLNPP